MYKTLEIQTLTASLADKKSSSKRVLLPTKQGAETDEEEEHELIRDHLILCEKILKAHHHFSIIYKEILLDNEVNPTTRIYHDVRMILKQQNMCVNTEHNGSLTKLENLWLNMVSPPVRFGLKTLVRVVETACLMASDDERVATELKKAIMQACTEKKLTQSQLAQESDLKNLSTVERLGKNGELVRKSSGNRSPKSIVEPAKYVEKPAKWGNQKVAPQNIHQPR
ncbi:hypothetical protein HID58_006943 [Brassica napus]|uniref:Uncharacterized protein n=1 Tax=Brassica napus TaxID=3708 RepID=A0ABQ8ECX1_BRANA|nr:hypothetical protein HID58_006943 [Brassica napus]